MNTPTFDREPICFMYNKSNVIYSKREATMYKTLLLASVLTTFTLGVSVSAISLHDPTGEGRAAFEKIAVYNRDIVKVQVLMIHGS